MKYKNYFLFFPILILILLSQTGCGDKVGLGGKVTFEDGQPLSTGTVCFDNGVFLARGTLRENGTYTVGSVSTKDGIPPGKYKVYIESAEKEIGKSKTGEAIMEPLIDSKFTRGNTSELSIEVSASTRKFDITVTPYVPNVPKKK